MLNVSRPPQSHTVGEAWPDALPGGKSSICPNTPQMCGISIKHDVYDPNEKEQTGKCAGCCVLMMRNVAAKTNKQSQDWISPIFCLLFLFFLGAKKKNNKKTKPADDTDHPLDLFFYSSHV